MHDVPESETPATVGAALEMLDSVGLTWLPQDAEVMTAKVTLAPGSPGTPPHRHAGPVFGFMLEGEMVFELEGRPERVLHAGESFWEPGGDVVHYQAANNLSDEWTRFVVVMVGLPGEPMLTIVDDQELAARRHRRAPRPAARENAR
jgi:quercetin dioxygenase-like cupin family protein